MNLARMHDIAGCRIIFPSIDNLIQFRTDFHKARFNHRRRSEGEDRWNYIENPKRDGYRGIHDVYEYDVRSVGGVPWNGLLLEIQYRTFVQHAWSTAVEVAGLLTHNNPKFGRGSAELIEFFSVASELISRAYERRTSCLPDVELNILKRRFVDLEKETRIINLFKRVNRKIVDINFKKNNILVFPFVKPSDENRNDLEILTFDNVFRAISKYNEMEKEFEGRADIVLVRADSFENMRFAFRNYFADTTDFVMLADGAVSQN